MWQHPPTAHPWILDGHIRLSTELESYVHHSGSVLQIAKYFELILFMDS